MIHFPYIYWLVVSTHLKNMSRIGFTFPNFRDEHKKYLSCHHPVYHKTPTIHHDRKKHQSHGNPKKRRFFPHSPELKTCHRFSLHGVVPSTRIQGPPRLDAPNRCLGGLDFFFLPTSFKLIEKKGCHIYLDPKKQIPSYVNFV